MAAASVEDDDEELAVVEDDDGGGTPKTSAYAAEPPITKMVSSPPAPFFAVPSSPVAKAEGGRAERAVSASTKDVAMKTPSGMVSFLYSRRRGRGGSMQGTESMKWERKGGRMDE